MFTCGVEYSDFVVCNFSAVDGIFDEQFWAQCFESATLFFNSCLLPELVGKWWTSSSARLSRRLITAVPGCLSGTPTAPKVTATAACGAPSPTPAPSTAVCPEAAPMKVGHRESTFTSQTTPVLSYSTPSSLSLEGNCSVPISCRFCTITTRWW